MIHLQEVKLTEYSQGAGDGCKISPQILESILSARQHHLPDPNLLVGNESRDDAAVYDLGDGTAIISTTDFFTPIVDDAYDFGRIASVNAISDVYAMGGSPMMAVAILGWPLKDLEASLANRVLEGSRRACAEAGIPLAGGHSIESKEPIFGLAVSGRVNVANIRRNAGALPGCKLFLTKPLGIGLLTTAQKKKKLHPEHAHIAMEYMVQLNQAGEVFSKYAYVKAMTDVTGFGLLGHLIEMCEASKTSAVIDSALVPQIPEAATYIKMGCVPGGTKRNFESYGHKVNKLSKMHKSLFCDPQTSGGLLIAVIPEYENEFTQLARGLGMQLQAFGHMTDLTEPLITVN